MGIMVGPATGLNTAGAIGVLENVKFTPRISGPLTEVEDADGVVKAFALQVDGGDLALDAVYESNTTTSNFAKLGVGNVVACIIPTINNGSAISCTVVSLPEVTMPKKGEVKLSFKAIWRPGAV